MRVILVVLREGEHPIVRALPVTHSPPTDPADAIEIPAATKQRFASMPNAHGWS